MNKILLKKNQNLKKFQKKVVNKKINNPKVNPIPLNNQDKPIIEPKTDSEE